MTITDAELAQRTALEQLAARCVQLKRGEQVFRVLDPSDPEGTPLAEIADLPAAAMNEIQGVADALTTIATDVARRAFEAAAAGTPPGTKLPTPSPATAMGAAISTAVVLASGTYTLAMPGAGGATLAAVVPQNAKTAEALAAYAAQLPALAVAMEIEADALVSP